VLDALLLVAVSGGAVYLAMQFLSRKRESDLAKARSDAERFRGLTELSADWFWETDAEHRFVSMPTRVDVVTRLGREAYIGKPRWEVAGLSPVGTTWPEHRALLDRHESFRDLQLCQVRADGSRVYLQISGEPTYAPDGAFTGYHGTAKDVTERTETVRDRVRRTDVQIERVDEEDFRRHWAATGAGTGMSYEQCSPAYGYGCELGRDERDASRQWSEVEGDARRQRRQIPAADAMAQVVAPTDAVAVREEVDRAGAP